MRNSTTYKIAGPKTLRLASAQILTKKLHSAERRPDGSVGFVQKRKGWGGNLQNIEKGQREIYIPDGVINELIEKLQHFSVLRDLSIFTDEELEILRIFVQVDQSGAEALIVAYCCEAGAYRSLFTNGIKPHTFLGMHLFKDVWRTKMLESKAVTKDSGFDIDEMCNTPIPLLKMNPFWRDLDLLIKDSDNWPVDQRYYYLAKQTEHSSNYDIHPPTFRMNILEKSGGKIVISKEDSERFLATKHGLFPEIKGYHRYVQSLAEKHRRLYNLHGHPYEITHYELQESSWKELYAWIPQSTVGEITNIAYSRMQQYISDTKVKWDLLANTHDSYLLQCPLMDMRDCALKAKEFMEQEFVSPIDGAKFRMRSEAQAGFNWSPAKKDKNVIGLREIKGI